MIDAATIATYLALVAKAFANMTDANVDAVEAFEAAHPGIEDASYQAGGPYTYDPLAGVVHVRG